MEPKAPLTGGEEAPTARSEFFTKFLRFPRPLFAALALVGGMASVHAALTPGDVAPPFAAPAALAGESYAFDLREALQQGPVVLYFYPAAFTQGCTIEAQAFAAAIEDFRALGATVVGVSGDNLETLKRFSVSACASKFAVAADDDHRIMKAYDTALAFRPGMAGRISYVISPAGKIIYAFDSPRPHEHVSNTLEALRQWRAAQTP